MSAEQDVRWEQRFKNYNKALAKLDQAVQRIMAKYYSAGKFDDELLEPGDDIIIEGLIQRFEYTHELAWNVMKDFTKRSGNNRNIWVKRRYSGSIRHRTNYRRTNLDEYDW